MSRSHTRATRKHIYNSFEQFLHARGLKTTATKEVKAYVGFCRRLRSIRGFIKHKNIKFLERHHMCPRVFCGKNCTDNYVMLTEDEYVYAHRLLYEAIESLYSRYNFKHMYKTLVRTQVNYPTFLHILRAKLMPRNMLKLLTYNGN